MIREVCGKSKWKFKISLRLFGCAEKYTLQTTYCALWGHRLPVTALALSARRPFGPARFARRLDNLPKFVYDIFSRGLLNVEKYIAIFCFRIIGSETPKGLGIITLLIKVRGYMVVTLPSVRF